MKSATGPAPWPTVTSFDVDAATPFVSVTVKVTLKLPGANRCVAVLPPAVDRRRNSTRSSRFPRRIRLSTRRRRTNTSVNATGVGGVKTKLGVGPPPVMTPGGTSRMVTSRPVAAEKSVPLGMTLSAPTVS